MDRQAAREASAGPGSPLLLVTEPTETAGAEAFAHTAVLAGRPGNCEPLREIGQLFGRVAHLLDAVEDYRDDVARGKWNPLAATATLVETARALCDDAVLGIELALADVEFTDGRLAHRLLTSEVRRAASRNPSTSATNPLRAWAKAKRPRPDARSAAGTAPPASAVARAATAAATATTAAATARSSNPKPRKSSASGRMGWCLASS